MSSLIVERSLPRFAAARLASTFGTGRGVAIGPLRLVEREAPPAPGPGWHPVRPLLSGICGSDLATVDGRSSRYFEDLVSFPFVPGHEVVGVLDEGGVDTDGKRLAPGTRVVLEPVLGCTARDISPACGPCASGQSGNCERVAFGHLRPGLQTGFCADTGGGWSTEGLVAHASQLHPVPDHLSDADAVTVEPVACAVHAVLRAGIVDGDVVAVVGAGTLGLAATAALAHLAGAGWAARPSALLVGARYRTQQEHALALGATAALPTDQLGRAVRRTTRSLVVGADAGGDQRLTGGADVVIDCVGTAASIEQSLAMVRPRGRVVLVGMPARVQVDLASLWHREISLGGAYAYGTEARSRTTGPRRTFDLAFEVVAALGMGRLVSATYPLDRFEEAIAHAGAAGRRGAVKIAFDLRLGSPKRRAATPLTGNLPVAGGREAGSRPDGTEATPSGRRTKGRPA